MVQITSSFPLEVYGYKQFLGAILSRYYDSKRSSTKPITWQYNLEVSVQNNWKMAYNYATDDSMRPEPG